MSVTAHSPFLGHKRLHRDTDSPDHQGSLSPKRLRYFAHSRCHLACYGPYQESSVADQHALSLQGVQRQPSALMC